MVIVLYSVIQTDLASLYIKTGTKNISTVLLLTDTQIPEEHFLVPVSDLLASGGFPLQFSMSYLINPTLVGCWVGIDVGILSL